MKKVLMILAVILLVSVPAGVLAATSDAEIAQGARGLCGFGFITTDLTEEQKADVDDAFNQMINLRKATINTFLEDGIMTQDQADLALERVDEMIEHHEEDGSVYGMMGGFGRGGMMGGYGCYDGDED
ncbi:DUF2680 domain-containing protein [Eubacteriaceae bacterium ES3]|nr:DUF2680 domain-containing protein [Eubacteriaceae bacterium ES3]